MRRTLTGPLLPVVAMLVLFGLLVPGAAAQRAPAAASASGAGLTSEQAVAVATSSMEVGANDFRLSDMGQDNTYDAFSPAVAYNSTDNEYLVVWYGDDDDAGTVVDGEYEIYGQRVDAATGVEIGPEMRLSDMGPDGDPAYDAYNPAVAYNSTNDEYLVVWASDDNAGELVNDEFEIFGQRVEAATGAEIGINDFRISDMGPDGNADYVAAYAAVAYNSADNEYLVVWAGSNDLAGMDPDEAEIYGQRLDAATGAEVGVNDFLISSMGAVGDANYLALHPAVAHNPEDNEYLVVWSGDDNTAPLVDNELEVFANCCDPTEVRRDLMTFA